MSDGRTIGRLAWHIAQTVPEMMSKTGLQVAGMGEHDPVPASAAAIAARSPRASVSIGRFMKFLSGPAMAMSHMLRMPSLRLSKSARSEARRGSIAGATAGSALRNLTVPRLWGLSWHTRMAKP